MLASYRHRYFVESQDFCKNPIKIPKKLFDWAGSELSLPPAFSLADGSVACAHLDGQRCRSAGREALLWHSPSFIHRHRKLNCYNALCNALDPLSLAPAPLGAPPEGSETLAGIFTAQIKQRAYAQSLRTNLAWNLAASFLASYR
jgi:hypothetical protein